MCNHVIIFIVFDLAYVTACDLEKLA